MGGSAKYCRTQSNVREGRALGGRKQASWQALGAPKAGKAFLASVLAFSWLGAVPALAEPAPKSLDQALSDTLALGDAAGCFTGMSIPDAFDDPFDPGAINDDDLAALRSSGQLGKELAAVCGSSAVNSAAALGGSLGSLQTTKTVSQFRLVRRRIDSRLDLRGKRFGFDRSTLFAAQVAPDRATDAYTWDPAPGGDFSVFVQGEHEWRDRETTALEAGYEAKIASGLVGIDYASADGIVLGAWVGYQDTDADYSRTRLLVGSPFNSDTSGLSASLDSALLSDICNLSPGGGFGDGGFRFGTFAGARFGQGFADVALQYSARDYDYRRNVCAIETPLGSAPIVVDGGVASGFSSGGIEVDDIYAGTISGKTRLTEWSASARAGVDFGGERLLWGPRVSLTYLRSHVDGFTETGRTSVTNTVNSNGGLSTPRAAGDPTGLELTYGDQSRTSVQLETQMVAAYRVESAYGTFFPRVSVAWIHEFKGDRERVSVRMAEDHRATPTVFSFTTDSVDRNKGILSIGLAAVLGARFVADLEITRLIADDRFEATTVTAQARWRF